MFPFSLTGCRGVRGGGRLEPWAEGVGHELMHMLLGGSNKMSRRKKKVQQQAVMPLEMPDKDWVTVVTTGTEVRTLFQTKNSRTFKGRILKF